MSNGIHPAPLGRPGGKMQPWLLLLGLFIGIGLSLQSAGELARGQASTGWPSTDATIFKSDLLLGRRGAERPVVSYRYRVGEAAYAVQGVALDYGFLHDRHKASAILDSYPVGKVVPVRYDPRHPDVAVLQPGPASSSCVGFGGGLLFISVCLFLLFRSPQTPFTHAR